MTSKLLQYAPTERGFDRFKFTELNGHKCSIQKSSIAETDLCWIGCEENILYRPTPSKRRKVMEEFRLPSGSYQISTRMELSQEDCSIVLDKVKKYLGGGKVENFVIVDYTNTTWDVSFDSEFKTVQFQARKLDCLHLIPGVSGIGWLELKVDGFEANNKFRLTREHLQELIPVLEIFVGSGELTDFSAWFNNLEGLQDEPVLAEQYFRTCLETETDPTTDGFAVYCSEFYS
jgi:hypothetical protein